MFHPPTGAVTTSIPHQATSSLSMFATVGSGSSSSNGDNTNGKTFSSEQRRPFWATRPAVEDDTTSKTITATVVHTIDHKVNATGAAAGLAMDDVFGKESKKAKASKKKKTVDVMDDDEEEIDDEDEEEKASAKSDPNTVNNSFIAGKIAADQKITKAISKQIVDQVFEILSEVCNQRMTLLYFNEAFRFLILFALIYIYIFTLILFSFAAAKSPSLKRRKYRFPNLVYL